MNERIQRIASLKAIQKETEEKIERLENEEVCDLVQLVEEKASLENLKIKIERIENQAIRGQLLT